MRFLLSRHARTSRTWKRAFFGGLLTWFHRELKRDNVFLTLTRGQNCCYYFSFYNKLQKFCTKPSNWSLVNPTSEHFAVPSSLRYFTTSQTLIIIIFMPNIIVTIKVWRQMRNIENHFHSVLIIILTSTMCMSWHFRWLLNKLEFVCKYMV